jgi:hypothetical protein
MKYVKILGLAAVAAAALMAFVGASTASATVLCKTEGIKNGTQTTGTTCPSGWAFEGEIHAVFEPTVALPKAKLTTAFKNIECEESTVTGKTTNEGSATETVDGKVEVLTFGKCNCEVVVIKTGTLELHWIENSHNGTLTSNGAEVTAQCESVFGPVHCIYVTENTDLGTLTGSATTGGTATMDIESANIPRLKTDPLCAETAKWDAKYKVTTPDALNVTGHT